MKTATDKTISRKFVFSRKLIVCPPGCSNKCRCKGAGFFYELQKTDAALAREAYKKSFKDIEVSRHDT